MSDANTTPIIVSSNYAGACEPIQQKQDHVLTLSKNADSAPGSSLFTLKYGVLPCTLTESSSVDPSDSSSDDERSIVSGERRWNNRRHRQESMYHITRLVHSF